MEKLDIKWKNPYPANVLSNFYPNAFIMDGVRCASMEGFLQALKYRDPEDQLKVCALTDISAKDAGAKKKAWKWSGNLYWQGKRYKRGSKQFDALRLRAYIALSENQAFIQALEAARGKELTHSIGKRLKRTTVLTKKEFTGYLGFLRQLKGL